MARETRHANHANYFEPADPSVYLLDPPKSRRRLGKWGVVAVLAGTILAVAVIMFEDYLASLF